MYEVATEHGDGDKPVWFSEIGWSDWGNDSEKEKIGDKYVSAFDTIKKELPFVEVVFVFRLTSLFTQNVSSAGEMNFGIFYNPQDPVNKGAPKPAAISIAKYINGEDYDLTPLYKYCNAQE